MKQLLAISFITLLALGMGCAWIAPSSQTTSDGIQVHGHWTMTVTNSDGSVDAVHEFDNALLNGGLLTNLLLGLNHIDKSYIRLKVGSNIEKLSCLEQIGTNSNTNIYLQAQPTVEFSSGRPFTLSATCTVLTTPPSQSQTIESVFTVFEDSDNCIPTWHLTSTICPTLSLETDSGTKQLFQQNFTQHDLSPSLSVSNGQQIGFNVKISFN
tara:strand:- start:136 stop:768 length:633 start_codon:yes stop_codon:yes gene_type:complete